MTEVQRIHKKMGDSQVPTPLIIREGLPDKIRAAWYAMDVRRYIPSPCTEGKKEGPECSNVESAICIDEHLASDKRCQHYRMEKEIIIIKIKEKLPFSEARKLLHQTYKNKPGLSLSKVVKETPPQEQPLRVTPR